MAYTVTITSTDSNKNTYTCGGSSDQGRSDGIERYITAAQDAAGRAAALTHRLLAFSRRQTLEPKPTDATALVAGIRDLIDRTVGPEATVEVRDDPALWPILVDPSQLENALLNRSARERTGGRAERSLVFGVK